MGMPLVVVGAQSKLTDRGWVGLKGLVGCSLCYSEFVDVQEYMASLMGK